MGAQHAHAGEVQGIDHPSPAPRFDRNPIAPAQATLYLRLDLGIVRASADEPRAQPACGNATANPDVAFGPGSRNRLGLRGDEKLSGLWSAHWQIEHSLRPDTGTLDDACARFWDARATVSLSHKEWGRIDLGRRDQPAWAVALRGDPWGGDTVASPALRLYAVPRSDGGRSSGAISYSSRPDLPLTFEYQTAPRATSPSSRGEGGSIRWDTGALYAGVGRQRWGDGSWAMPLAINVRDGTRTWFAAATRGRHDGFSYVTGSAGVTIPVMDKGDPYRREWHIGLTRFNAPEARADWKLAAGWRYHLSRKTAIHWNTALIRNDLRGSSGAVDIGIAHSFDRDLRYPQSFP